MDNLVATLKNYLKEGKAAEVYILVRYMYRIGRPLVSDIFYDKLHNYCINNGLAVEYTNRTYDDDPVPYDLLDEFNLTSFVPKSDPSRSDYISYLDDEKSLSIRAVTNYKEAFEFFMGVWDEQLVMSMKGDGVFSKTLIIEDELKLSLSRGRSGNGIDYTENIIKVLPTKYNFGKNEVKLYGEAFVLPSALRYLAEKYDPSAYKMEKSSAISMLRVEHDLADYKFLKVMFFNADGLSNSLSETLKILEDEGLEVVPHIVIPAKSVPRNFEEFQSWLKDKLDSMWELRKGLPSDGVVVDVDSLVRETVVTHQYADRNIALKMEQWSPKYYEAKVTGFTIEQQRVEASVRLNIEPTVASDRSEAKVVNGYNLDIVFENNIAPGETLTFERNSGAINVLLYGEKLRQVKLGL